jgi:hypothetical protein
MQNTVFEPEVELDIIQDVRSRYPNDFPDVYFSPIWYGRKQKEQAEGHLLIVADVPDRDDEGNMVGRFREIYKPCTDQYKLVRHEVAIHLFEQALKDERMDPYGKPVIEVSLHGDGRRCYVEALFPNCHFEIRKGEKLEPKAGIKNSNDLSLEFCKWFGGRAQVCANGMIAFKINQISNKKHRLNLEVTSEVLGIPEGMDEFADQVGIWQDWAKKAIAKEEAEVLMDALPFGARHQEEILALPQAGTGDTMQEWLNSGSVNVYDMYGIYTQFLTHEVDSEMVRVSKGEDIARIFHKHFSN